MSRSAPTATETDLLHAYMQAIPFALPHMRIFRRNILSAKLSGGHHVRAGIPGQADAYAYVRRSQVLHGPLMGPAIPIEIECKGARTRWTEKQEKWRAWCEEWGVPFLALEALKDEAPARTVQRWVDETRAYVEGLK